MRIKLKHTLKRQHLSNVKKTYCCDIWLIIIFKKCDYFKVIFMSKTHLFVDLNKRTAYYVCFIARFIVLPT